ncbi:MULTISPECIES: DUF5129 domain-containing protein [Glutamicibacter]|uniref:DUF5129 domain-containing protein n=1 Tax=Glutamicibacter creatinolyticus TaxID=162496 RepID=A0A5B7WUE7_9MICC|nr:MULTISPECIES: DUF5129 domain-containing protein [Glutamicibacter]QCY46673.1 hypothetical protein GcLGCM259_0917 [Glutamicibacter creatinolyticus]TLK55315.1 DUF5129 domain-containing protein [Glutamicibacter sp. V16R2B1]
MSQVSLPIRTAAASAVAALGLLGILPAAHAAPAVTVPAGQNLESVTVNDTAGVINEDRVREALEEVDFYEPTKVVVYTREGNYADNINTKTLLYARTAHPEWISQKPEDHGDYWADGYFIITLSLEGPDSGQVGTYFGEDRKVSDELMEKIHEAGYEDFKQARWSDGIIAVATEGAAFMNRPWYKNPVVWVVTAAGGGVGGIVWGSVAKVRSNRRKKFADQLKTGTTHLTNVTMDLDTTELAARTLPTGSHHAADLERRFADFVASYRSSFTEQQELEAATKKERSSAQGVVRTENFLSAAQELDSTDDAIIAASALYTRSATWETAWRAQTAPLLEDLEQIPQLVKDAEAGTEAAGAALESFRHTAVDEAQFIGTELKAEVIDADTALDRLAQLREQLTEKLEDFATAQIDAYAQNDDEKEDMRRKMRESRSSYSQQRRGGGSILDVTSPAGMFWRVQAYNTGYSSGVSSVTSSREAASSPSSGISHGYSGGGGSFSGAGGSSRF